MRSIGVYDTDSISSWLRSVSKYYPGSFHLPTSMIISINILILYETTVQEGLSLVLYVFIYSTDGRALI